jgi:hypothetical protein
VSRCVRVGHEDLQGDSGSFDKLHLTRRPALSRSRYQRLWAERLGDRFGDEGAQVLHRVSAAEGE